ncbi:unnamed protein product [Spirodela intermedia]|uniref:Uncharacterized protein n=2 Tax=Spirodela intermedia TaxID=51605 RepID=A0A7I8JAL8_SPIIN|nr:unnamed protein product [Spirodela intermedia]CAA6666472.1 unnamed protein product [Spirodela intermedia]CAA7403263.1 unnamed protein product [Spirodela intermedia]
MRLLSFLNLVILLVAAIAVVFLPSGAGAYVCMEKTCDDFRLCDELCRRLFPGGGGSCDPPLYLCCCKTP